MAAISERTGEGEEGKTQRSFSSSSESGGGGKGGRGKRKLPQRPLCWRPMRCPRRKKGGAGLSFSPFARGGEKKERIACGIKNGKIEEFRRGGKRRAKGGKKKVRQPFSRQPFEKASADGEKEGGWLGILPFTAAGKKKRKNPIPTFFLFLPRY